MGLILDTGILIAGERRQETVKQAIQRVQAAVGETEAALSTVSIVELTHGIYRARTDADRERRKAFCDELCRDMIVHPVSLEIVQLAGRIEGERPRRASPSPSRTSRSVLRPCISASTWPRSM